MTLGVVFGLRLRQTDGLLASVLSLMESDLAVPDHTTLSRRAWTWRSMNRPNGRSIAKTGPVHVLIDSTGLEVYGAGQWRRSTAPMMPSAGIAPLLSSSFPLD